MAGERMDILLIADAHVEHSVKAENTHGERQSFLVLDEITRVVESRRPRHVVILGDFFDAFGQIEASLAVRAKEYVMNWRDLGARVYFIVGNHEYQRVRPEFFGRSVITALFGGMEDEGLFVIDREARFVRMDKTTVLLGLPYRETMDEFIETCLNPIRDQVDAGAVTGEDRVIVGWHVGLPFGEQCWRGDEEENGWIRPESPMVQEVMGLSTTSTIFCGHYHGPAEVPCGDYGRFIYVGSPATRSKSESGQNKRVLLIDGEGGMEEIPTGLLLDQVVPSVEAARAHLDRLVGRFGEGVLQVASVYVDLGKTASMDDYNVARVEASKIPGFVKVELPMAASKSQVKHLKERHLNDPTYTKSEMEMDFARKAVSEYFRNRDFRQLSEKTLEVMANIPIHLWIDLQSPREKPGSIKASEEVKNIFLAAGVDQGEIPELTPEFAAQALRLGVTRRSLEAIGSCV